MRLCLCLCCVWAGIMDVAMKLPGGQQRAAVHLQPFLRFFHRFQARRKRIAAQRLHYIALHLMSVCVTVVSGRQQHRSEDGSELAHGVQDDDDAAAGEHGED